MIEYEGKTLLNSAEARELLGVSRATLNRFKFGPSQLPLLSWYSHGKQDYFIKEELERLKASRMIFHPAPGLSAIA